MDMLDSSHSKEKGVKYLLWLAIIIINCYFCWEALTLKEKGVKYLLELAILGRD